MNADMDTDDSEQATTLNSNYLTSSIPSMEDFAESCDYYPPINLAACATSSITYGSSRRKTVIVPQNSINYYLIIGRVIHEGKSPVHSANVADGPSPARSTIRPYEHAVKVYPLHLLRNVGRLGAEDPLKEVQVLQFLRDRHPNILSIVGCYREFATGEIFLDMPLYPRGDGLDLMDYYKQVMNEAVMSMDMVKTAMRDLLLALEYLHSMGITHHDVSPEQLLFDEASNRFVLIDFGMCIRQGMNPQTGSFVPYPHAHFCGKKGYWAPEIEMQSDLPSIDPTKRDIWSLGPTLVMLLTGEKIRDIAQRRGLEFMNYFLFASENMQRMLKRFEKGRGEDFALAVDFIASVMKFNPADRPTASQLLLHPWLTYTHEHK